MSEKITPALPKEKVKAQVLTKSETADIPFAAIGDSKDMLANSRKDDDGGGRCFPSVLFVVVVLPRAVLWQLLQGSAPTLS